MRFSSCLVVLVGAAASASARPVPDAHVNDVFPRELQYSDIAELEGGAPEYGKLRSDKAHHGGNYANGYNFWDRDHHERPHHARHPQPHPRPEEHGVSGTDLPRASVLSLDQRQLTCFVL